jgi:hypothetical protein
VSGSINVRAGWTSLTGLSKNGGSGTLSGSDRCGDSANVAGVSVPNAPGYVQNGGSSVPSGSPNIENLGTQADANSSVNIDWDGIVNGGAITPTITIPGQSWPASFPAGYWPTILIIGDYTLLPSQTPGRGLLIVTGSLTINGASTWDGIMLVGGNIISNGNNSVFGATISGLNEKLGIDVPNASVGNGTKTYRYDSCSVSSALAGMGGLQSVPNAWVDNWSIY